MGQRADSEPEEDEAQWSGWGDSAQCRLLAATTEEWLALRLMLRKPDNTSWLASPSVPWSGKESPCPSRSLRAVA